MVNKIMRKLKSLPDRFVRLVLHSFFQFNEWHLIPLLDRDYARDIISFLNAKPSGNRGVVVEIGCGLGDIIRNLQYKKKIGYDLENNSIKAALFLSRITFKRNVKFELFAFPQTSLKDYADTIIMVNWIHHISPDILKEKLKDYFLNNLNEGGEIIIDTVQETGYKFNHDVVYLTDNLSCALIKIGEYVNNREVFAIRKKK